MIEGAEDAGASPEAEAQAEARAEAPGSGEGERFERSMRELAEAATAMTAASLRLQMMMLEQAREMLGDFQEVLREAAPRETKGD